MSHRVRLALYSKHNQIWHVLKDFWIQNRKQMPVYSLWRVICLLNGVRTRWRSLRAAVGEDALGKLKTWSSKNKDKHNSPHDSIDKLQTIVCFCVRSLAGQVVHTGNFVWTWGQGYTKASTPNLLSFGVPCQIKALRVNKKENEREKETWRMDGTRKE